MPTLFILSAVLALARVASGSHTGYDVAIGIVLGEFLFWWMFVIVRILIVNTPDARELAGELIVPGSFITMTLVLLSMNVRYVVAFLAAWAVPLLSVVTFRASRAQGDQVSGLSNGI
jgi:hypothetical protein